MNLTVLRDGSERIFYSNPALPIYVNRGNLRDLSGMSALCHWHENVELLLPYKGHLTYNVNGSLIHIPEGCGIFVNSRNLHYGFSQDGTDCEYFCVTFPPQLLCCNEDLANRYVLPLLTDSHFPHILLESNKPEHSSILAAMRRLDSLYQEKPACFEMQAYSILFALWAALLASSRKTAQEAGTEDPHLPIVRRMVEFIRSHYMERITLEQIAASGGVCRSSCCQLFKKHLGHTPNDYLNSYRLERGVELLRSGSLSVTEIADRCGFSSSSYFTELFTRSKGCSPSAFRKQ